MKVHYDSDTDSLYIDLSNQPGVDANEVAPGIVLDFDASGRVVGIDIQRASTIVDLNRLETEYFPVVATENLNDAASPDR